MAAQLSFVLLIKAFLLALIVAAVSGQDLAPAPSPDAGAGFSLPLSAAVVGTSLLFSLFALLRH